MKKLILTLLVIIPLSATAQHKTGDFYLDSLLLELPKAAEDTNKVLLLDQISYTYSQINPDEGIKYGLQAMELAENIQWEKGLAAAYSDIGSNYKSKSDYTKAIYYYTHAKNLYAQIGKRKSIAAILHNLSTVYLIQSNYNEALKNAFEALKIYEELNEVKYFGVILENIGSIYIELKNYSKTMEYYEKALENYNKNENENGIARCLGNIGIVYDKRGNYSEALKYHFKALAYKQKAVDKSAILNSYTNIGIAYKHQKNYAKALQYYKMALNLSKEIDSKSNIAINLGNMGEIYFAIAMDFSHKNAPNVLISETKAGNLQLAIKYLTSAIDICKEINFNGPLIEFSEYISKAHMLSGNYEKSIEAFEEYKQLKDSVFSEQNMAQFAKLESKRELELKDRDIIIRDKKLEIAQLKAQNTQKERVILIAGIIILIFVGGLAYMKFHNRIKQQSITLDDISQTQSHYVRGPIARILGLLQLYNENDIADPINKEVISHLKTTTTELDDIVKELIAKAEA